MSDVIRRDILTTLRRPSVLFVLIVLTVMAVTLNGSVRALGLSFKKQRVELQKPLTTLPTLLGPWRLVTLDMPLNAEIEHALGTKDYITRHYVDTRVVPASQLIGLDKLDARQRAQRFFDIAGKNPKSAVTLHLAYYTGLVDTVAHVPDRCMVGGGFDPDPVKTRTIALPLTSGAPNDSFEVRYIEFHQRSAKGSAHFNVAYAFHVNGGYESSATGVRARLQNLFERYGYYCKIELTTYGLPTDAAQTSLADFVTHALPEITARLPDWSKLVQ
jgi:hypothetical protein